MFSGVPQSAFTRDVVARGEVHGVHAPVPAMACRGFAAIVATRNLPARAGAHDSPSLTALDVRAWRDMNLVHDPFTCRDLKRWYLKNQGPLNFWSSAYEREAGTG